MDFGQVKEKFYLGRGFEGVRERFDLCPGFCPARESCKEGRGFWGVKEGYEDGRGFWGVRERNEDGCGFEGAVREELARKAVDLRRTRLVSVATQKFIAEIASDAFQLCKARQAGVSKEKRDKQQKDKRLVLTTEDLSMALREYGVNMKHQEYFADSTSAGTTPTSKEEC
ncbi:hypothetical protein SUGI_0988390 [Cryptomeria japonica]|nr:hypothetical protein SUGI_0988390 [Cryptomeria japonica]